MVSIQKTLSLLMLLAVFMTAGLMGSSPKIASIHAAITSVTSANAPCPGDSARICKNLIVTLGLTKEDREVDSTIESFVDVDMSTVNLNDTIRIKAKLEDMSVQLPLNLKRVVYNSYELFDPGEGCAVAHNVGACSSEQDRPVMSRGVRESDPVADRFVLCCIGSGARRMIGAHCLRTKRGEAYEEYKVTVPAVVLNQVNVDIVYRGIVNRFPMNSLAPKQTQVGFGEVFFLENYDAFPDLYRFHPSTNQYSFFRDMRTSNGRNPNIKDIDNWFYVDLHSAADQYDKIGIDVTRWAASATCSQPLHHNTRTHDTADHYGDQFYELRQQTVKSLIESTGVTNNTNTLQVITNDDANNPVTLRFRRDPAQVTVVLTIYDVLQEGME